VIEGRSIVHEVTFPHPPERVWQALVTPHEMTSWLMPGDGFTPVPGRHFTMECEPYGLLHGEVLEADPPRRLAYRWVGSFGATVVTFQLTPTPTGTHVRLEHSGWDASNGPDQIRFDGGWGHKLGDALGALLTPAPPRRGKSEAHSDHD